MDRFIKTWNSVIWKPTGLNPTNVSVCLNNLEQTGDITTLAVSTQKVVKQLHTKIAWTLKGPVDPINNMVFRVTILVSQPYALWTPFAFTNYFPGLTVPITEYLFSNYYPSTQIRTEVLEKVHIIHDRRYLTNANQNVVFDEIFIPEMLYSWGKPNDYCPRMNGLWFLITALDCSNHNTAIFWTGGQNSAPSYDLSVSYFLE